MKLKIALLLCLMGAALFSGAEALRSLKSGAGEAFPEALYAPFARNADRAAYVLGREGAYLAVFPPGGGREPLSVTAIELQTLRRVDRAMVEAGLPVRSRRELLQLLEDLGS
ncbi:MAG: hypothetical protein II885_09430 [Oscillospiraceae bacterium]|nr:hypothetical protein [Oscillospiraceae bacterium]